MEEINLKELFDYFKERIIGMLIILLIVVVVGSTYSIFLKKPKYRSTSTIVLVSENGAQGQQTTQSDVNLNQSLVATYSEIVKSRKIAANVIKNLSLDYDTDELLNHVTVSTKQDTEIIKVEVVDSDKGLAADITNEIIKEFSKEISSIYKLQNVSQIDVAEEAEEPYNINIVKDMVIYLFVGIVLAFGVIFVIYYFDTTIKSSDEVENRFDLPVIGVVPKVKRKEK